MYLTFRSLPELAPLSKEERRRLLRACWWKPYFHLKIWVYLIPLFALTTLLNFAPCFALIYHVKINLLFLLLFPLTTTLFILAASLLLKIFIIIPELRPHLRAQLGGFCLHCGYDLRASSSLCPECGTPFPPNPNPSPLTTT